MCSAMTALALAPYFLTFRAAVGHRCVPWAYIAHCACLMFSQQEMMNDQCSRRSHQALRRALNRQRGL
eukprot:5316739-Pleurochrysis_carterae.AAC.1